MSLVRAMLHLEGAVTFGAATWAYYDRLDGPWLAYFALLLLPDLSIIGYLRGRAFGAWMYNAVHTDALALIALVLGIEFEWRPVVLGALILAAHIGIDRAAGYGLKFTTSFRDTHLQRLT